MITCGALAYRQPYVRAGEYRRPSMRARPLTEAEREALRAACNVPPQRWREAMLQRLPEATRPYIELARSVPGQLVSLPQLPTSAPPAALAMPVAAEDCPSQSVPRAEALRPDPVPLSDRARAALEKHRRRYGLPPLA